jgi:hypothetical protein
MLMLNQARPRSSTKRYRVYIRSRQLQVHVPSKDVAGAIAKWGAEGGVAITQMGLYVLDSYGDDMSQSRYITVTIVTPEVNRGQVMNTF